MQFMGWHLLRVFIHLYRCPDCSSWGRAELFAYEITVATSNIITDEMKILEKYYI